MYATFMHELGHALGLDHNNDRQSIMTGGINFWKHFGPWQGDHADLRDLYPLRTGNRLRLLESDDGGATWRRVNNDVTNLGSSDARTTHSPTAAGDRNAARYLLGWTTPRNRFTWLRTNGRAASDWQIFGGGPEAMFGSAMAAGASNTFLWAIVTVDGDDRRLRMLRSRNDGAGWHYVNFPNVQTYGRPGLAFTEVAGRDAWVAVWGNYDRSSRDQTGYLYASVSFDNGTTWSQPQAVNTFYKLHDGVSIDCNLNNQCLLGFVWGGESGTFAYGQNRLRFMRVELDLANDRLHRIATCYPSMRSRIAPGIAYDDAANRFIVGVREQDFNTSQGVMRTNGFGCPGPFSHLPNSSTHVAPDAASHRFFDESVFWSAHE